MDGLKHYVKIVWKNKNNENVDKLGTFVNRMKKIGIDVKLVGNYPWIYINSINNKRVTEKFQGNHGFTIAFLPIRENQELHFTDISKFSLKSKKNPENFFL